MLSVELDVHTESIAVASVAKDYDADVLYLGTIGTRQADIDPLGQRQSNATHLVCVYEAGPCGDWLSRDLTHKGHHGWVVAPSPLREGWDEGSAMARPRCAALTLTRREGEPRLRAYPGGYGPVRQGTNSPHAVLSVDSWRPMGV
jgi:transposase